MKNLVFQSKYLVFRNTRYFESEISKYQVFHTLNLKYWVFRAKYLLFQKRCEIPGFQWIVCISSSIGFHIIIRILINRFVSQLQSNYLQQKQSRDIIIFSVPAIQLKFQVFEILGISLEIPSISNSRCEKPSISKFLIRNTQYFDRNPRFSIEILSISIEILGFSFEIHGISKICDNRISYKSSSLKIRDFDYG